MRRIQFKGYNPIIEQKYFSHIKILAPKLSFTLTRVNLQAPGSLILFQMLSLFHPKQLQIISAHIINSIALQCYYYIHQHK